MHLVLATPFSAQFFQAICWILIHSLWQGLAAAIVAAVIISLTKRSVAAIRYNLLVAVLLVFVLSMGITAWRQFHLPQSNVGFATISDSNKIERVAISFGKDQIGSDPAVYQNWTERLVTYCNQHALLIVMIWFLLFLIKCTQLVAGLQYIHRIRRSNVREVTGYWEERLHQLSGKVGIQTSILFLESAIINVPAVIGFLKPALLVPVGLLSNLPPQQVEAILLHELAHIYRRDFLVNLVQSFIDTFFFFNPAVIWISSLIRQEREACCDDMVIANTVQKNNYLQALVSFQELQLQYKTHAIALTGNKHYLFNRVKRMLTQENKKLNLMEKTVLLLSIVGMTAFSFISEEKKETPAPLVAKKEITSPVPKPVVSAVAMPVIKKNPVRQKKWMAPPVHKNNIDTVPNSNRNNNRSFPSISSSTNNNGKTIVSSTEATDDAGMQYRIKRVDGQLTELSVDGKIVPKDQYDEYDEVIRQIEENQKQRAIKRKEERELKQADMAVKRKELFEKRAAISKAQQAEKMKQRNEIIQQKNLEREQQKQLFKQREAIRQQGFAEKRLQLAQQQQLMKKDLRSKNGNEIDRIISDLANRNLVSNSENLSFSLTNNELIVNGAKQPAEIHQQFKDKYIQNSGDSYKYLKKGNSTSITINHN